MKPMTRISVLGGGWLGQPLALALVQAGYLVQVSTASAERYAALVQAFGVEAVHRVKVFPDCLEGTWCSFLDADVLIINIPPLKGNPIQEQFAALLERVQASAVKRVLLVSSTGVYAATQDYATEAEGLLNTDHKLYRSEQFWQTSSIPTTVVRLAGLIGGQRHPGRFFQRRGTIPHPDAPVNLIHRDDAVALIQTIVEQEAWGAVYNGCADTHPIKGLFYPKAAKALGLPIPSLEAGGVGAHKIVSNDKMKALLGKPLVYPDLLALLDHWT